MHVRAHRLRRDNHTLHMPKWFTGIVDCAPIRVHMPARSKQAKQLYYGKYKCAVLKVRLQITFSS